MTRELIIEGQHVDLSADTDITLEYVNNIIGDMGQINLSHSYTVKLPKTLQNARILDDPGNTSHESSATRRYLSARYYRNGIDLIGPAQAYILKTTPDSYEVALIWNTLEALQSLSQYSGTLNDLPSLPLLAWIGSNGMTPDYTASNEINGALFAYYNSGLGNTRYPTVNTATHPSMRAAGLLERILAGADVPYTLSEAAVNDINDLVILAAPKHTPTRMMERTSGSIKKTGVYPYNMKSSTQGWLSFEYFDGTNGTWQEGWDGVYGGLHISTRAALFNNGGNDSHRIALNLKAPDGFDLSGARIVVRGVDFSDGTGPYAKRADLLSVKFIKEDNFYYAFSDEPLNVSGWPFYEIWVVRDSAMFPAGTTEYLITFSAYDSSLPMFSVNREHKDLRPDKDNRFPLQGNLPDIKQWDFVKACMAMLGWVAVIQNGTLHLLKYTELFDTSGAYDWSAKVDITDGGTQELNYTLENWAQVNAIAFEEDTPLGYTPTAELRVSDTTLPERRDFYKLPFAASMQSDATHYKVDGAKVEDVDIAPRIFRLVDKDGVRTLEFTEDLYGEGLISAHYARLQEVIRKPVRLTVNIRLHEIDLAQLDLTRAVYLGQYGKYYIILKIQTSDTDLCKVELLQLP